MADADNAVLDPEPLRVGLIADEVQGPTIAAALLASARWDVVVQHGYRPPRLAAGVPTAPDARAVLEQRDISAVVLATSTPLSAELDGLAAPSGVMVWRPAPFARNFAEAVTIVRNPQRRARVASWWDHIRQAVQLVLRDRAPFRPLFTELHLAAAGPEVPTWRAGLVDAGGGGLTLDAYTLLDALVALCGLPDSIVAATARHRRNHAEPPRAGEDVVTALMRYDDGGLVQLRATWDVPPFGQSLTCHGPEFALRLNERAVALLDRDGAVLAEELLPTGYLAAELNRLADLVLADKLPDDEQHTTERHLAVTALIETTYLSSRTWHPESPHKLYEVQGWREPRV